MSGGMEVRRLADAFPQGEVEKASARVAASLDGHRQTLHTLQTFLDDNHQLTKLVQDLPHKVSHSVMVPFGKAAFFPGRLIHTNEFLVLLGNGYYAECSASRTLDILARQGKGLESQIAGVKSQIADLDVESRFFSETLAEVAGGAVEIREEYMEPASSASASIMEMGDLQSAETSDIITIPKTKAVLAESREIGSSNEDKEHELLMARLDELEAAEAASNYRGLSNPDSDDDGTIYSQPPKHDGSYIDKLVNDGASIQGLRANGADKRAIVNADHDGREESANGRGVFSTSFPRIQSPGDILKFEEWRKSASREDVSSRVAEAKRGEAATPQAAQKAEDKPRVEPSLRRQTMKAFTGTVLERGEAGLPIKPSQAETPRRPASKFKLRQKEDR